MDDSEFASKLQQLIDMGFSDSCALEALTQCEDMDSAVNYLFNKSSAMPDPSKVLYIPPMSSEPVISPPLIQPNYPLPNIPQPKPWAQPKPVINMPPPSFQPKQNLLSPVAKNQSNLIPFPHPQNLSNNLGTSSFNQPGNVAGFPGPFNNTGSSFNKPGGNVGGLNSPVNNPPGIPQFQFNDQNSDEDFLEFLSNNLKIRGTPDELINEIVAGCSSKEEALLILGIPISFSNCKLSQIPKKFLIVGNENVEVKSEIVNDLMAKGASKEEAELISITCNSLSEAHQAYYENLQGMKSGQPNKLPNVPKPIPLINNHYPKPPKSYFIAPPPAQYFNNPPPPGNLFMPHDDDLFFSNYSSNKKSSGPVVLNSPSESDPVAPDSKTEYFETLKGFRLTMSENPAAFNNFIHGNIVSGTQQALKRINNEIKTLQNSVPCDSTASIFVMIDSECMHRIKFLLSGTIDTPYAHGLYLFDVLLPTNYPQAPPKVSIMTTGNGRMRFNPNLYSNGYVCLSIINTWSGRPEEQWNPSSSTLLQVMLSIQSLVMDNDILQKEPSFHGMPRNAPENIGYQQEVMYGNLKFAMIDMIKNPPIGMEEIVRNHFKIKKTEILETVKQWILKLKQPSHYYNGTQNQLINQEMHRKKLDSTFTDAYMELESLLKSF